MLSSKNAYNFSGNSTSLHRRSKLKSKKELKALRALKPTFLFMKS